MFFFNRKIFFDDNINKTMTSARVVKIMSYVKKQSFHLFSSELFGAIKLIRSIDLDQGERLIFGIKIKNEYCNLHGTLHGGAVCTLTDMLTTIHAWSRDPYQRLALSTDLSSTFFLAVKPNDYLEIATEVIGINKQFAYTTACHSVEEKIVARGTQTLFFIDKKLILE